MRSFTLALCSFACSCVYLLFEVVTAIYARLCCVYAQILAKTQCPDNPSVDGPSLNEDLSDDGSDWPDRPADSSVEVCCFTWTCACVLLRIHFPYINVCTSRNATGVTKRGRRRTRTQGWILTNLMRPRYVLCSMPSIVCWAACVLFYFALYV
jgi:hypothetical protein